MNIFKFKSKWLKKYLLNEKAEIINTHDNLIYDFIEDYKETTDTNIKGLISILLNNVFNLLGLKK